MRIKVNKLDRFSKMYELNKLHHDKVVVFSDYEHHSETTSDIYSYIYIGTSEQVTSWLEAESKLNKIEKLLPPAILVDAPIFLIPFIDESKIQFLTTSEILDQIQNPLVFKFEKHYDFLKNPYWVYDGLV